MQGAKKSGMTKYYRYTVASVASGLGRALGRTLSTANVSIGAHGCVGARDTKLMPKIV